MAISDAEAAAKIHLDKQLAEHEMSKPEPAAAE